MWRLPAKLGASRNLAATSDQLRISSHEQVQIYCLEKHKAFTYFGFYELILRPAVGGLRIAK